LYRYTTEVTPAQLAALNGPVSLEGVALLPMNVSQLGPQVLQFVLRWGAGANHITLFS
jgi:hypothetical protein